jgi:protein tyrosine kinase modulator
MIAQRQLNFDDYLEILRRRWWVILIPALAGCAVAFLISLALPSQYTSTTLVLVEQQKVPDNYVKSVVTGDIAQRLGTMREQILSRTRLEPIIDRFGLYKKDRGKVAVEDLVERMRQDITVTPIQSVVSTGGNQLPGFSITFTANDPHLAQQVCAEITSLFIEVNLHEREQSAVGTTDFLKDQLGEAKRQLDAQDAKLAEFKRKYMGTLPGDEQNEAQLLGGLSSQLDAVTNQLSRAQQDKSYEESLLNQQLTALKSAHKVEGKEEDTLEKQLTDDKAQLASMQGHYTADYPDVIKLKSDIAALEKKIANQEPEAKTPASSTSAGTASAASEPLEIQQMRLAIHTNDVLIQEKTKEQNRVKQQMSSIQGRLSISPVVEEQYKAITRDHDTAIKLYDDLLAKRSDSEMATNLERRQLGGELTILDAADLPERPSFPNRPAFAGGGFGIGFMLGIGLVMLLELRDKSIRTEADAERALGLPILASVPVISESKNISKTAKPKGRRDQPLLGDTARA